MQGSKHRPATTGQKPKWDVSSYEQALEKEAEGKQQIAPRYKDVE